jgi:transcriptional regulator with XRE-family HTH domain
MTALARQISTRMKAKNLSTTLLERDAGLKTNAVQNILRGKSKKPSAEILQAVADILGCTVKELLTQDFFQEEEVTQPKNALLNNPYEDNSLFLEVTKLVHDKVVQKKQKFTVQQVLTCTEEIYLHSLQKDSPHVDEDFADWFIDLIEE